MNLICLQRLNPETLKNEGGLYLNPSQIAAFVPQNSNITLVLMSCGVTYSVPFAMSEILEILQEKRHHLGNK
jgi:hypothetical protein